MKRILKYIRSTSNYNVFEYTDINCSKVVTVYLESCKLGRLFIPGEEMTLIVSSRPRKRHECNCKHCTKSGQLE